MTIVVNGFLGPLLITGGYGSSAAVAQPFRVALISRLGAIPGLTAIVGTSIYPGQLPEAHDLGIAGPALCYTIPTNPRGQVLSGADGTSIARVKFDAWAYLLSDVDGVTTALWNALDGVPGAWGDGTCTILSVTHQDEEDDHSPPQAGSDQWTYHIASTYSVKYRTGFPTLS
jgi:hypothetical protein